MTRKREFAYVEEETLGIGGDGIPRVTRKVLVGGVILPLPDLAHDLVRHWELACDVINAAQERAQAEQREKDARIAFEMATNALYVKETDFPKRIAAAIRAQEKEKA